jgi:hypothetical protein
MNESAGVNICEQNFTSHLSYSEILVFCVLFNNPVIKVYAFMFMAALLKNIKNYITDINIRSVPHLGCY